jgi:Amt family ammonium transporter
LAAAPPSLSETSATLCVFMIFLVPLAVAGLALVNTGLVRSRSAAHVMLASLCVFAVAAIVYAIFGFSLQGAPGRSFHVLMIGGEGWDWIAAEPFFLRGLRLDLSRVSLVLLLQMFSVGLAAIIPLGAGSERWRLGAACASTILLAAWTYPLFAHWVLGGGWLSQLGSIYGLGQGFADGGAGSIQVMGGLSALSIAWTLGPRQGKYPTEGVPAAIPAHNVVLVLTGCLFAWVGWLGLNSAGAILFNGSEPSAVVLIAVNTTLSAAASALTAAVVTRLRFGRPDASLVANGWMAGLVASSAAAAFLKPPTAVLAGFVAGGLVVFAVDLLEFRLGIDDPGGTISVHALAGLWGLASVSLLSNAGGGSSGQWLAQLIGIATLIGFIFPLIHGLNWLIDRVCPHRVDAEGEWQGMDLHELGAAAYPEFVVHSDEFTPR